MKKVVLGMILGILMFLSSADIIGVIADKTVDKYCTTRKECFGTENKYQLYKESHPILYKLDHFFITPSLGLKDPLTNRCNSKESIEYFDCNNIQIYLNKLIYSNL